MALRERLASKARPSRVYPLRIEDDTEAAEVLAVAEADGDADRVKAARSALEACYEWLKITALSPIEWEGLLKEHPPTAEQVKADQGAWCNQDTFVPALLAECIEGPETAEDWAEFTRSGPVSPGEVGELAQAVWLLNERSPGPWMGKGSTQTAS